jgi:hypothetical protein
MYLSIDEVLAEAMSIVKDKAAHEAVARQWIWTNLMQTGVSEEELEVVVVYPKNLLAKKPKNCRRIKEFCCFDSAGLLIPHTFRSGKKRIYPNTGAYTTAVGTDGGTEYNYQCVDVSEDKFNLVLGTNATDVAQIALRYYALPLDSAGEPLVHESEKLSCIYYVRFQLAMLDDSNQSKIQLDEIRWKQEVDRARAAKKSVNEETRDTVGRDWLRLLPSFNPRKF